MARRVVMSCPSSCARRRVGASSSAQAKQQRERQETDTLGAAELTRRQQADREFEFDAERIVARVQGREGWLRDARRQLEQRRWQDPDAISRSRSERLVLAAERLEADLDAERRGNEAYEAVSGARADEGRAAVRRAAEALHPAGGARTGR